MEELYKKYSMMVYNYLNSLCERREISEELMQETFYKAIKNIKKFRGECEITTWLCQIAKNEWNSYLARERKIKTVSIDNDKYIENLLIESSVEDKIKDKNEVINLYKQVHKLDEKTKEVFYLRIKGELSFKEIGEILDKSEEWARVTFYRGKLKLKEELKNGEK